MPTTEETKNTARPYVAIRQINPERISDLLCCAFEGGSNYWVKSARRSGFEGYFQDVALHEDAAVYVKTHEDGNKEFRLDRKAITTALAIMFEEHARHFGDFIAENDDATTGDVFLQLALFGKVIYG